MHVVAPASAGVVFHQAGREVLRRRLAGFAGFHDANAFFRVAFFTGMRSSMTADANDAATTNILPRGACAYRD
ncbi:MAG TPA: hypothetical protein VH417_13590 [Vicinamibacterales bacterium]|jgi:hypothetical protein